MPPTFGQRRFRKADVETYYDRGTRYPSINVKVYAWRGDFAAMLPLELGGVADADGKNFRKVMTDEGFTLEWLEANLSDDAQQQWWDEACREGWEQAEQLANEMFGQHDVKVYGLGRSGGHLVVDGLPEVEGWDGPLVSKWGRFVKEITAIKDDTARRYLWLVNANVYEPLVEEQAEFTVTWRIDQYAGSAREAAKQALEVILNDDPDNTGRVFDVLTPGGNKVTIDLSPGAGRVDEDLSTDTEV